MTHKTVVKKPLTDFQFKQKMESHVWKINQAMAAFNNELYDLVLTAEDRTTALVETEDHTLKVTKLWNQAEDIREWAESIQEMVDGIDPSSILLKLRQNEKKHKKRTKNVA